MIVKITDQNLSNEFTWMAISPRGIFRNGECIPDLNFLTGQTQYTLDMNNSGAWVAASENTALLNGTPLTSDGITIQSNNGVANELLCKINDFSDYACLTSGGVFRNEDRGLSNAKLALDNNQFTPTAFKHALQLATNGAVALLSEHTSITDRTGVYWGGNVLIPAPPQPTAATLSGTFIDWTDGGGSTVGYLISVGTNPQPASASEGNTLYIGTDDQFNIVNFSDFMPGVDWQPLTEIPPGNAAISQAGQFPPEWTMTRTFSDPTMTTQGFYRVKSPP